MHSPNHCSLKAVWYLPGPPSFKISGSAPGECHILGKRLFQLTSNVMLTSLVYNYETGLQGEVVYGVIETALLCMLSKKYVLLHYVYLIFTGICQNLRR